MFRHLGYPTYLLPFVGTAKILGVAAVLFPGFGRVKEWAYAGLVFDLTGALHSHLSVGDPAERLVNADRRVGVGHGVVRVLPKDSGSGGQVARRRPRIAPGVAIRRVTPEPE